MGGWLRGPDPYRSTTSSSVLGDRAGRHSKTMAGRAATTPKREALAKEGVAPAVRAARSHNKGRRSGHTQVRRNPSSYLLAGNPQP
jgi:hypothetical protein